MAKPYKPKIPASWWLKKGHYFMYVVRELTAVFVATYCVTLLVGLSRLKAGPEAWQEYVALLQTPACLVFHTVALLFAIYHSITWFNLTPKVVVVQLGENKLPPALIAGGHYAAWIATSVVLVWVILA